ncbi:MAG: ATP-grasp domain-containing protein [Clostridia bacterium]|nr:ATP-grasp domain-containing protein [Clostridia bacterium]
MKGKLGIIGASYLQVPLIEKAKEMGLETYAFAWAAGDPGESLADHFYPISIVEKEAIAEKCREIGIDGICTIASDLAAVTVGYVAHALGLAGNSPECVRRSTNKHAMRRAFAEGGDPSPQSILVERAEDLIGAGLRYPLIVKPLDRSGSRGIMKLEGPGRTGEAGANAGAWVHPEDPAERRVLDMAIENAKEQGFEKKALAEEFAQGEEYSVEGLSWQGKHRILTVTKKYTTGSPHFIETGHLQPAGLSSETEAEVRRVVAHALCSLGVTCGASHSELKIAPDGTIRLIEIGARMGGDLIGSDLVPLSTGVDYVAEVIRCAMGQEPLCFLTGGAEESADGCPAEDPWELETGKPVQKPRRSAGVRFIFGPEDLEVLSRLKEAHPEMLIREEVHPITEAEVTDSSARFGYFLMAAPDSEDLRPWLENA